MSDLLEGIAKDLSIMPYYGESDSDYCYRVCYSALALVLLNSARSIEAGVAGISKNGQADRLLRVLSDYEKYLGLDSGRFIRNSDSFISHFRKVYEATGYLSSDSRGFETIAPYGRTVPVECGNLYFGIPPKVLCSLGLGIYTDVPGKEVSLFDAFIRDTLSTDEYIAGLYNPLDFEYRDIDLSTLEFFNPYLKKPPSSSWETDILTSRTVARNTTYRTMYRTIREEDGKLLFADIAMSSDKDSLGAFETRRLFFALKDQYGEPTVAWFQRIDDSYYEIRLSAQLPTREYYLLLLCAWPKNHVFDRISFLATASILPTIDMVLKNIGIKTIWR